jgi:hypothetical protein
LATNIGDELRVGRFAPTGWGKAAMQRSRVSERFAGLARMTALFLAVTLLACRPSLAQALDPDQPPVPPADVPLAEPAEPSSPLGEALAPPGALAPALPGGVTPYAPSGTITRAPSPTAIKPPAQGHLVMTAHLVEGGPALKSGVVWRVFAEEPGSDGRREMVAEAKGGTANFALAPGVYYVYCGFGHTGSTDRVTVGTGLVEDQVQLNAGGVRLNAIAGKNQPLPPADLSFDIFALELDARGEPKPVALDVKPGEIVRLAANTYTVEADYGSANASTSAEIEIKAGKLSDITLTERAAKVTLKLVSAAGGEAIADTAWSVLTQAGDLVTSGVGAFPSFVLAEGDYTVVARHAEQQFQRVVTVRSGEDCDVEVIASN